MPPRNALAPAPYTNQLTDWERQVPSPGWERQVVASKPPGYTMSEWLDAFQQGLGRGLGQAEAGNLQFYYDVATRPVGVYEDLVSAAKAVARNPSIVVNGLRAIGQQAASGPRGLGEVVGGFVNPRNFLKPKKAIMSGMATDLGPYGPGDMPKIIRDNPGGDWLTQKRKYSEAQGTKPSGAFKYPGELTASYDGTVYLPVSVLERIPGENMEQYNVRQHSLDWLTKEMSEKNRLPTYEAGGKEFDNAPFITVDSKGRPFVTEGNHRIMVAKKLGWQYLPVEIRYFNGGELEEGPFKPENLRKFTKQIEP